ncbi:CDP-glycerol glycerophosphotransferase [Subsaximicrobium wynnwilliamsii]|uniref:CDP-glycerol glycerophosphotransferase n=1 Tax=Subsaximicrobium wynnwilliamsii TaxID=291179 RepID=A0A5C6ZLE6_9FLAO|nr:UDP-N-acetylglucosamine 2-epimerase [Subsaximicrobium wynnwilliamsii]TXD84968.1 CDP-glycerol glycerophosphotransferase [Subsaximicrobium wynnwilliamsii]TXD90639.1 CDP-glycerol glycerophosphotransferase [Subsaximicrobium wynnwilliamsii]TXE05113.1 CDP-glycerol glycerophosphotransferase [Subsaximicrobium wynnwilliamsii]
MNYKFLIYISYSYAIPIGKPLEQEILKRGYTVKWFSDLESGKKALANNEHLLATIEEAVAFEPHIVLAATDDIPDFISGLKVQIFHGFFAQKRPEENNRFAHFRIRGFFDLYCTQGPSTTSVFKKLAVSKGFFKVEQTGWSKMDPLFPLKEKARQNLPTVMIASTFTQRLSLAYHTAVFKEIERLSNSDTYQFIMVLHPKLPDEIIAKWKSLENQNFKFYDTTDLIPLFQKADFLFADTTSAIQEFLLQKKPVVTFRHTLEHDYLIQVEDTQHIEKAFEQALQPSEALLSKIEAFIAQLHPYEDGKSSTRVINATIDFLHADKTNLKNKPLNLIRKYKIRKRLDYFTLKSYSKAYTIKK